MITQLIDKNDYFEIIRDKVAQILANESASQQALATASGKDPRLWKLRVFTERSVPWDDYADGDIIVNVWYDNGFRDAGASDPVERQKMTSNINIDVVGFGDSQADGTGQLAGDERASRVADRGARLARNIIMASTYTYLEMRGVVWARRVQSIAKYQPQQDDRAVTHAVGARLSLEVDHNEFSPQYEPQNLEYLSVELQRAEDNSVIARVDFDYTQN